MRARWLLAAAALVAVLYGVLRLLGADADTSVIGGMPRSDASWVLGPLYVLASLCVVTVAPILAIAALFDVVVARSLARDRAGQRARTGGAAVGLDHAARRG